MPVPLLAGAPVRVLVMVNVLFAVVFLVLLSDPKSGPSDGTTPLGYKLLVDYYL